MLNLEKDSSKANSENISSHTFPPTSNVRNGFRRKKGDSPFTYNLNLKVKKEKKQSNFTNPDPWARIVGSRNTAAIYMNGIDTTALFDTGAEIQLVSKQFCEDNEWEIQPVEKLTECSTVSGEIFGYEGFVEVNVQIPGRDFSEDHLFLVTSELSHQKEIPVVLGTYFIESLSKYLHGIDKTEFDSLDYTVKQAYLSWIEATRIREKYGCEPPLGFVKTTKPVLIQAGTSREIHGLTKIKHGGYAVNCISEPAIGQQLPSGLKLILGYSPLSPGSCRVSAVVENSTGKDITIPARTTICQLGLANRIPKLIYPGDDCDNDQDPEEVDDTDEGLTYKQFEQYKTVSDQLLTESEIKSERTQPKVVIEDIGPDMEEDIKPQNSNSENTETTSIEDDGSWILDLIDLSGLENWPERLQLEAKEMLKRNAKVFSKDDMDMGRTNLVKHHIKLTDPVPFKEAYRRIPPQMYDEVKTHLQEMLDLGAIRPSNSPWASAIVLVRKKDGRLRFCIDLRKLNNRTVKDAYSLPRIESILDSLGGAQIFSTLDLKAGYWQVEMAEECKAYTAFTCGPLGFYECDTMPFGATNAPATFQRLMHDCLGELNMNWCIVYLDDIIIFSDTKEEHLKRLEAVFQKLCAAGLKLKPSKCFFFREEIEYLGHVVSGKGISTNPKKIEAVSKWPTPKTVYDVRSFLGFVGYYRRFIKNFSRITKPIREVITGLENQSKRAAKKTYIEWTDAADAAFENLKTMCVSTPILAYPDYQLPFTLHTDSSTDGLGAVLYQKQNGKMRVIAYASRSVSKAESNYPDSSDKLIPMDVSLPSQYLLPNLDDSSSDEETEVTELCTETEPTIHDNGKEMQSINSEAESLVDTKEFLEFVDTMDVDDTSKVDESDTHGESIHDVTRQDEIDPKSESQFSSFMSYHEGESSSLDPGTNGMELCKSPIEDSAKRHDSGVVDQGDIIPHDSDLIAYESNDTSVPSIDISDQNNIHSQSQSMTDDTSVNPIVDVEIEPVRRSARERKQTQLFGNPWLYRISCNLTPRVLSDLLQHVPDISDSLTDKG